MHNNRLIEEGPVVSMLGTLGAEGTHGPETGPWVSLRNHNRICISLSQGQWSSGTPAITLKQAKDASGTGAKALSYDYYWQSAPGSSVMTPVAVNGGTFNLPAVAGTVTALELNVPTDLDVNNGFCYVQLLAGTFSGDLSGCGQLYDPAIAASPATQPNVLA